MIDVDLLSFLSLHPLDKILSTGTVSYTNSGATSDYAAAKIQNDTIVNPHNKLCLVRFVWSVDTVNYNAADSRLLYQYTTTITPPGVATTNVGLQAAVAIGISSSLITFQTANSYHGNVVSVDGGGTYTYTPTSQTFTIKYALFEID